MKKILLFLFLALAISVYAETPGNITFPVYNSTTGLFGYSVYGCNNDTDCFGYKCFRDYDGMGNSTGYNGWCNTTSVNCYHSPDVSNLYLFANGGTVCDYNSTANNTYRTCDANTWSVLKTCASGYYCTPDDAAGSCSIPSGSGSGTGSGGIGGNTTSTIVAAMIITAYPGDFEMVQGSTLGKTITVKNTGNKTLNNVTLSLSGISWYSVSPVKISSVLRNTTASFSVNFNPPASTAATTYTVTIVASSAEIISPSKSFILRVTLSEQSVNDTVIPDLNNYTSQLADLEKKINELESRGVNVSKISGIFLSAKSKLTEAKALIETKDYTSASRLIDEAKDLLGTVSAGVIDLDEQTKFKLDPMWIVYGIVALGIIAFLAYILLPPKEGKRKTMYELLADQENGIIEKIKRRLANERKAKKN